MLHASAGTAIPGVPETRLLLLAQESYRRMQSGGDRRSRNLQTENSCLIAFEILSNPMALATPSHDGQQGFASCFNICCFKY
jgi:hypothetical protein